MILLIATSMILGVFIFLFFKSLYRLAKIVPSSKTMRHITGIKKIGKNEKDIIDIILDFGEKRIFNFFSGMIHVNKEKKRKIENDLLRVGSKDNYERFVMKTMFYPIFAFLGLMILGTFIDLMLPAAKIVGYILKTLAFISAIVFYFEPKMELKKKLEDKELKITLEMPRFIRTYRYSPHTKGLYQIVGDYLVTAKEGLDYDLTVLKADIDLVGEEKALYNMSIRVNLAEVREFVTVLLTSLKGNRKEADMSLYFVEMKFLEKADRIADKEMLKRPEILDTINELLMQGLGMLLFAPMAIHCFLGITDIMK